MIIEEVGLLKNLYFCEHCRKKIDDVSEIHYIEDNSDRGLCSDTCIMEFYRPYLNWLEKEEAEFRGDLNIKNEDPYLELTSSQENLKKALEDPQEVWILNNEIDQQFFTHIYKFQQNMESIYYVLICSYVENEPSFVFYRTATKHIELVDKYRREIPYKDYTEKVETSAKIPSEIFESIEQKKSEMLADMLTKRSMHDIPLEEFTNYEDYFEKTLEDPDEVFERVDDEGDSIHTYIKSFKLGDESFFYVVVGYFYQTDETVIIPIISFPSVDRKIYPEYAKGNKTLNKLKN